jgi:putative FmdB family regulatory protein
MPLYEYYCADCKTKFDALRPMSKADDEIQCKHCESMRTSRALSLFATFSKESSGATQATPAGFGGCCGGSCGCSH